MTLGSYRILCGRDASICGIGVQRARVQATLGRMPMVASFRDAPPERGGLGATLVVLPSPLP